VILAISIQNIPEGTSVAIPMAEAGFGHGRQFWAAVATSAPQPIGALIAYFAVEQIEGLLPFSFVFAAGAMLALIVAEMLPRGLRQRQALPPQRWDRRRRRPDAGAQPPARRLAAPGGRADSETIGLCGRWSSSEPVSH
jgi:hypothetical protein